MCVSEEMSAFFTLCQNGYDDKSAIFHIFSQSWFAVVVAIAAGSEMCCLPMRVLSGDGGEFSPQNA